MSRWIIPATVRIQPKPSPNFGRRPAGAVINTLVLHADASPTVSSTLGFLTTKHADATQNRSYHLILGRIGDVYRLVEDEGRAWHAGASAFRGVVDCNNYSVGVCFSNNQAGEAFSDAALAAGVRVCADLLRKHPAITIDRITTHTAVASCDKKDPACRGKNTCAHYPKGRKHDPGALFPLHEFVAEVARVAAIAV
jgi:N-acetyl-anhydromuramyl-L-alanine amidase AmpD